MDPKDNNDVVSGGGGGGESKPPGREGRGGYGMTPPRGSWDGPWWLHAPPRYAPVGPTGKG